MDRPQHLNTRLLAGRWGISPRTLERWRHDGHGPGYLKLGGQVRYPLDDIEAYEAGRRHAPADKAAATGGGP